MYHPHVSFKCFKFVQTDSCLIFAISKMDLASDDPLSLLTLAGPVIQEDDSASAALMNCDLPTFHKTPEPIS